MKSGALESSGPIGEMLTHYSADNANRLEVEFTPNPDKPSITRVSVDSALLDIGTLAVSISYVSPITLQSPSPGIVIRSQDSSPLFGSNPRLHPAKDRLPPGRSGVLQFTATEMPLHHGRYRLSVWLGDGPTDHDSIPDALMFEFTPKTQVTAIPAETSSVGHLDWPAEWTCPMISSHD